MSKVLKLNLPEVSVSLGAYESIECQTSALDTFTERRNARTKSSGYRTVKDVALAGCLSPFTRQKETTGTAWTSSQLLRDWKTMRIASLSFAKALSRKLRHGSDIFAVVELCGFFAFFHFSETRYRLTTRYTKEQETGEQNTIAGTNRLVRSHVAWHALRASTRCRLVFLPARPGILGEPCNWASLYAGLGIIK